jgi:hypothetical protein
MVWSAVQTMTGNGTMPDLTRADTLRRSQSVFGAVAKQVDALG